MHVRVVAKLVNSALFVSGARVPPATVLRLIDAAAKIAGTPAKLSVTYFMDAES
jgi:hypothetical protein